VRHGRRGRPAVESTVRGGAVHPGSYPGGGRWQRRSSKPRGHQVAMGGPANPQAVTRVNPEQASKGKSWAPTHPQTGEGRRAEGKRPSSAPTAAHRGTGNRMRGRTAGQRGKPVRGGDRRSQRLERRSARVADGPVVPTKPGNSGGGKGPCFWALSKEPRAGGLAR